MALLNMALLTMAASSDQRLPQITITEVNMARVFNWDVKERRKLKEQAEKEGVEAE